MSDNSSGDLVSEENRPRAREETEEQAAEEAEATATQVSTPVSALPRSDASAISPSRPVGSADAPASRPSLHSVTTRRQNSNINSSQGATAATSRTANRPSHSELDNPSEPPPPYRESEGRRAHSWQQNPRHRATDYFDPHVPVLISDNQSPPALRRASHVINVDELMDTSGQQHVSSDDRRAKYSFYMSVSLYLLVFCTIINPFSLLFTIPAVASSWKAVQASYRNAFTKSENYSRVTFVCFCLAILELVIIVVALSFALVLYILHEENILQITLRSEAHR